jgi:hypothetical protein
MYYHRDLNGKVVFKVKGVNTKVSELPTYEELCSLFINKSTVKFTDQTQYRRTPKIEGTGVIIADNLVKRYNLASNSKRMWEISSPINALTHPFVLNSDILINSKALITLPEPNIDLTKTTILEMTNNNPILETNINKVHERLHQYVGDNNSLDFIMTIENIDKDLATA